MDLGFRLAAILMPKSKFGQERRSLGGAEVEQATTIKAETVKLNQTNIP